MKDSHDTRVALDRLGRLQDHYTGCGIYYQGLFTSRKRVDDPTYECTCGWWASIRIAKSFVRSLPTVDKKLKASLPR